MNLSYPTASRAESTHRVAFLYGGFFVIGFCTVLLGPLIPDLEARWGLTTAQAGWLFVAQFAASSVGSVLSSLDLRRSLLIGYAATAAGLVLLALGGQSIAWLAMALIGLGLGFSAAATNLLVAARNPHRRGAALAILNLFWGFGAVGCPLIFAAFSGRTSTASLLLTVAAGSAILVIALAGAGSARSSIEAPGAGPNATRGSFGKSFAKSLRPLLPAATMLGLYVGVEITLGG